LKMVLLSNSQHERSSIYDNPYYFTGRRVDILDGGSLKIQYNRNRYYDYYTGRWLTHDPLGVTPNPPMPNVFDAIGQYKDSLSLYQYVGSNPLTKFDVYGLRELYDLRKACDECFPSAEMAQVDAFG